MEILKRIAAVLILSIVGLSAFAQQDKTSAIIKAFQQSYLNEASGDYTSAIQELKAVYAEDSYEINLRLGWLTYSSGLFTESMSYYNRAVTLKPFAIEPKLGLTYPAAGLGKWTMVIQQYKEVLTIAPNNTTALHKIGLIYYGRKDYASAEKYFEKEVNLFPFDYDALLMLGWTNFQMKKYREAKVLFNKALMNNPGGSSATEGMELLNK